MTTSSTTTITTTAEPGTCSYLPNNESERLESGHRAACRCAQSQTGRGSGAGGREPQDRRRPAGSAQRGAPLTHIQHSSL